MSSALLLLPAIYAWLIRSVCVSSALLCYGYLVARLLREPADRLRVLQWTLGITLASLILVALPANWKWTIPVITRSHDTNPQPITPTGLAPSESTIDRPLMPDLQTKVSPAATTSTTQAQVVGSNQGDLIPAPTVSTSMPIASAIDWPRMWMQCLVGTYCACCLFIVLRLVVAQLWLWRTLKHSVEVPPEIETQFHRIAGARAASVRLRLSNDVTTPVTWGLKSPVILLPTAILNDERPSTVQYCLAHEWSHVHRRDSWTWQFVVCLHAFLFYNPLYWLCRRSLLVTMDQLADSEAARLGDSPLDYAEFLVQLARHRQRPVPTLALGVADKHSQLRQRIEYLVANSGVTTMFCSPMRSLAIGTLAVVIGMAGSVVRFERRLIADDQAQGQSQPSTTEQVPDNVSASDADTPNQQAEPEAPAPTDGLLKMFTDLAKPQIGEMLKVASRKQADGSIVYTGFVTDASNDLPISGAKVKVHRKLSRDPKTGGWSVLEVTEHTSNAVGMYSFRLSPEQVEQPSLYIEVEAKHPNYASYSRAGYSHHMIVKNLEVGELPFYTNLALWPGQPIEGTVMSPDGKVVPDAEVVIYATSAKAARFRGGWERTSTDADGRFRVVAPSPGDGVLWIKPPQHSPQALRIRDRRGDWGEIQVANGAVIKGRVTDVNGKPVVGVKVEARRSGDGEEADEYLNANSVAGDIERNAVTDADGRYALRALPDGDYSFRVEPNRSEDDYSPKPLDDVFISKVLKVSGDQSATFDIQAVPHVVIQGTFLNSKGEPTSGHEAFVMGELGESSYFTRTSVPDLNGKFEVRIPHGLTNAKLDLMTNEHSALRWRMAHDQPLRRGRDVTLGTVEDDILGFEVVRYVAPILLVRIVDEQGKLIRDTAPRVTYTRPAEQSEMMLTYVAGGNVGFEAQEDGRYRSSQMLPDEPITITVEKDGYVATPREITLKEGENREIELVIKRVVNTEATSEGK